MDFQPTEKDVSNLNERIKKLEEIKKQLSQMQVKIDEMSK